MARFQKRSFWSVFRCVNSNCVFRQFLYQVILLIATCFTRVKLIVTDGEAASKAHTIFLGKMSR